MMKKILFLSALLFIVEHETNKCLAQSWDKETPKLNKAILKADSSKIDKSHSKSDSLKLHADTLLLQTKNLDTEKTDAKKNETNDYFQKLNSEYVHSLHYKKTGKANREINRSAYKRSIPSTRRSIYNTSSHTTSKTGYPYPIVGASAQVPPNYYTPKQSKSYLPSKKNKKQDKRAGYVTSKKIINEATQNIGNYQSPYQYSTPVLWQQNSKRKCFSCFGSGKIRDFYGNIYPCYNCKGKGKLE